VNQHHVTWHEALKNRRFILQFVLLVIAIPLVVSFMPYYFHSVIGPKRGAFLNDFILNLLAPQDHSWIIFGLIYLSLIITLQGIAKHPRSILLGLKCYLAITILRMIAMYIFTLEPPDGIIPLHDPIVDVIAYGGVVFNKDLFFSGHVSTLTLFVLLEERSILKKLLIISTVLVAGLILFQKVHYTIDVIMAPIVTAILFKLIKKGEPLSNSNALNVRTNLL
jgi:PAP2 superfamily protein